MDKYHDCGHRPRNTDKRKRKRASKSDTPMTDAVIKAVDEAFCMRCFQSAVWLAGHAEQMERERNVAMAAIRALLEDYDCKNEVMPAYYQALDALGGVTTERYT